MNTPDDGQINEKDNVTDLVERLADEIVTIVDSAQQGTVVASDWKVPQNSDTFSTYSHHIS